MARSDSRWVTVAGIALVLLVCIRTAWMSDDAYITLRSVDNIVNGFGPRWNVAERVQAFTHPAWLMLITPVYAITREAFFTVLTLQILLTTLTVGLCSLVLARHPWHAAMGVAALVGSKAFVDFSTAGLENPLTHFLLILFLLTWRRHIDGAPRIAQLGVLTSALLLCRLDMLVLLAPMLAFALWRGATWRNVATFALSMTPFVVWEAFSFFYYGLLVPNTALAKLPAGISQWTLVTQGLRYMQATWYFDPFTLVIIVTSLAVLLWSGRAGRLVAAGIALHLAYVISVGGDFMAGRFLTPAVFVGVAGVIGFASARVVPTGALLVAPVLVLVGLLNPTSPLRTGSDFGTGPTSGEFDRFGVTDERRFYYPKLGLLRVLQGEATPADHPWAAFGLKVRADQRDVVLASNVGLFGYYAGPSVYIIDRNALSDPFLARLPPKPGWRVGHYERDVPEGYFESRRANRNVIVDARLHRLYDHVDLVTRGRIWDGARLRALFVRLEVTQ